MADSHETIGQYVLQKPVQKLLGRQPRRLATVAVAAVSIREGDFTVVATKQCVTKGTGTFCRNGSKGLRTKCTCPLDQPLP